MDHPDTNRRKTKVEKSNNKNNSTNTKAPPKRSLKMRTSHT